MQSSLCFWDFDYRYGICGGEEPARKTRRFHSDVLEPKEANGITRSGLQWQATTTLMMFMAISRMAVVPVLCPKMAAVILPAWMRTSGGEFNACCQSSLMIGFHGSLCRIRFSVCAMGLQGGVENITKLMMVNLLKVINGCVAVTPRRMEEAVRALNSI